jgi:hypothetical protein
MIRLIKRINVVDSSERITTSGVYGLAERDKIYISDVGLVIGAIAADQATGYHFGDDGDTTAIIASLDTATKSIANHSIYGIDLEKAIREYEITKLGLARSEFVGLLTKDSAVSILKNVITGVTGNNFPN